jgi:PAP2 superfamily.
MNFLRKYKHAWIFPCYGIFYLICFAYLEKTYPMGSNINIIEMKIDRLIPFCEFFIIPYVIWYFYIIIAVVFFIFVNKKEYYQLATFLIIGMTVFLIISYLYPNGQNLRPVVFERSNIFVTMVQRLYKTDTSTNILPSIHVFNTIGVHIAIADSKELGKNKLITNCSLLLMISIILATMFLKQHSVIDVISGILLAVICYVLVYKYPQKKECNTAA